ncbi:MAG TPA: hypothetical protein VF483_03650, partial [Gemmatimonadaceae bacterium]
TARYFVLGELSGASDVWIALHGYAQLAQAFARAMTPAVGDGRVIVVPEALNRFYLDEPTKRHGPNSPGGASWMTVQDREHDIADYVAYLSALADAVKREAPAATLTVLGFSQGVATACRFAALGTANVSRLILWAGSLPTDLPADRGDRLFKGASVTYVVGRADQLITLKFAQKELASLAERGIVATLLEHDGGHSLNSELLRQLAQSR